MAYTALMPCSGQPALKQCQLKYLPFILVRLRKQSVSLFLPNSFFILLHLLPLYFRILLKDIFSCGIEVQDLQNLLVRQFPLREPAVLILLLLVI